MDNSTEDMNIPFNSPRAARRYNAMPVGDPLAEWRVRQSAPFRALQLGEFILVLAVVLLLVWIAFHLNAPSPLEATGRIVGNSKVCPGDRIRVANEFVVTRPGAIVLRVHTWWSVDRNLTAIPDLQPEWRIYQDSGPLAFTSTVTVPVTLTPGTYDYLTGQQQPNSDAVSYGVRVKVLDCSKPKPKPTSVPKPILPTSSMKLVKRPRLDTTAASV